VVEREAILTHQQRVVLQHNHCQALPAKPPDHPTALPLNCPTTPPLNHSTSHHSTSQQPNLPTSDLQPLNLSTTRALNGTSHRLPPYYHSPVSPTTRLTLPLPRIITSNLQ
jgi:hypothetical protein